MNENERVQIMETAIRIIGCTPGIDRISPLYKAAEKLLLHQFAAATASIGPDGEPKSDKYSELKSDKC